MGRRSMVAVLAAAVALALPALLPDTSRVNAQGGCKCFASVNAVNSDLRPIGRYYETTVLGAGAGGCATACNQWRRAWFYDDACDHPTRINRGTNAWWGYEHQFAEVFVGPETWWCPFPPP